VELAFAGRQKLEDVRRVVLMLAKDHTRKSLMAVKTLAQILEQLRNGVRDEQAFNSKYAEILKIDDECKELRLQAERKVLEAGALLAERGEYIRFLGCIDRIPDRIEGAAYRLLALTKISYPSERVAGAIQEILEHMRDSVESLNRAITALEMDSAQGHKLLKEVSEKEQETDEVFRRVTVDLLRTEVPLPQLLLSREIIDMLESVADTAEEAANVLAVLYPA
jgi:predicted phosphate transport protein (TIGR00153 family)